MAAAAIIFALVLAIVVGAYWMFIVWPEQVAEQKVRARLKGQPSTAIRTSLLKARERLSSIGSLDTTLSKSGDALAPISDLVSRSGLKTTVGTVILASIFIALITVALVARFSPYFSVALLAGISAGFLPFAFLKHMAARRLATFEEQFPEAIDLVARALRAGHALPTALQMVSDEIPQPVGGEFRLLFDQQNFGMSLPDALKAFGQRIPLVDARFFVTCRPYPTRDRRQPVRSVGQAFLCHSRSIQSEAPGARGQRAWPYHGVGAWRVAACGRSGALHYFAGPHSSARRRSARSPDGAHWADAADHRRPRDSAHPQGGVLSHGA
jgi:Flp pilus assembly protein TadB